MTRQVRRSVLVKETMRWAYDGHFLMTTVVFDHVIVEFALAMDSFRSFDERLRVITAGSISQIAALASRSLQMKFSLLREFSMLRTYDDYVALQSVERYFIIVVSQAMELGGLCDKVALGDDSMRFAVMLFGTSATAKALM